MAWTFSFEHRVEFVPERADEVLRGVVAGPGVFALRGEREGDEPYLTRAADVRRRLRRLLAPPEAVDEAGRPVLSKRLNLRERVRWIEWTATGSEFESLLLLYCATRAAFGVEQARRRLRLHAPYFLRVTLQHDHPRVYATNRLSARGMAETFGPFPSRAAAERYCDAVLDLFKLRRCHEDLQVHPEHPGCAYGEMKKCMEPCKGACSGEEYAREAAGVRAFFATRGESMLGEIAARREAASEAMDFEAAAALHKQWEAAREGRGPGVEGEQGVVAVDVRGAVDARMDAAVFLLEAGRICGPERLSTLGVRAVREQTAVGSSLFAQPLMLAAVPLEESVPVRTPGSEGPDPGHPVVEGLAAEAGVGISLSAVSPEERARVVLEKLEQRVQAAGVVEAGERSDFLALFRRWYYRPEKQRAGEVFLPNADGSWPVRRILNGAARVVLGPPREMAAVDREAAREQYAGVKTKVIHEGREGVERVVPVLPKRTRRRKAVLPGEVVGE
jgi:hypothetical protein